MLGPPWAKAAGEIHVLDVSDVLETEPVGATEDVRSAVVPSRSQQES